MIIHPIILCGGPGTRLWPLSRRSYPKQFSRFIGTESLFQQSARRLAGEGFAAPVIVTSAEFRFIAAEQLAALGITPAAILIEPEPRNTASAVLAGALWIARTAPDATILAAPSDHLIPDAARFQGAVRRAAELVPRGNLVTFGITPTRPETGYGYLELDDAANTADAEPMLLKRFVEKPDAATAAVMAASGRHLWNAGIFLFGADAISAAYRRHAPALVGPVEDAVRNAKPDLDFIRLDPGAWARAPAISIDYAIMEKADTLFAMPYGGAWSDLGSWDSVWIEGADASGGVVTQGSVTAIDCAGSLLRSEDQTLELVAIGVRDLVAVAMPDAVLVADRSRAQEVRIAVDQLRGKGARQADSFPRDHRPWGHFDTLILAEGFQVKRIVVKPGAALSLQSHRHRSEHWVVVSGSATVTVNDCERRLEANQSIDIPVGAKHRLANRGETPLTVIEVQTGSYLGEDDIVRYDDVYARP